MSEMDTHNLVSMFERENNRLRSRVEELTECLRKATAYTNECDIELTRLHEMVRWRNPDEIPDSEGQYLCNLDYGIYKVCIFGLGNWGTAVKMRLRGWLPIPPEVNHE